MSFRTCNSGELFAQRSNDGNSITLQVNSEGLKLVVVVATRRYETQISDHLIDNEWYYVNLLYRLGVLTLSVNGHDEIVANSTYNMGVFGDYFNSSNTVFTVGNGFQGCLLEGPGVVFNTTNIQPHNVLWGPCPLNESSCEYIYIIIACKKKITSLKFEYFVKICSFKSQRKERRI